MASSWIQRVTSVSAGPPLGGLYLKPPSSGGLCDGVTTIPSARPADATPVGAEDRVRDGGGRREAVRGIDPHVHAVGDQHLEGRPPGGLRERVRVPADEQRARVALRLPVAADRLGRGQDVGLVEGGPEGRSRGGRTCRRRRAAPGRRGPAGSPRTRAGARARPRDPTRGRAGRREGSVSSGPRCGQGGGRRAHDTRHALGSARVRPGLSGQPHTRCPLPLGARVPYHARNPSQHLVRGSFESVLVTAGCMSPR